MEEYYNNKTPQKSALKFITKFLVKTIYIILIILLMISSIMLVQLQLNPDETPSIFGMKMFCIISGSMAPEIKKNDIIIARETEKNEIRVGDIVSFTIDGETITHRILKISCDENNELNYTTKGDANNVEDESQIKYENIEGKYVFRIPKAGKITLLLQNKFTLMVILTILILLYLLEHHKTNKKEKRRARIKEHANNLKQKK